MRRQRRWSGVGGGSRDSLLHYSLLSVLPQGVPGELVFSSRHELWRPPENGLGRRLSLTAEGDENRVARVRPGVQFLVNSHVPEPRTLDDELGEEGPVVLVQPGHCRNETRISEPPKPRVQIEEKSWPAIAGRILMDVFSAHFSNPFLLRFLE